MTTKEKIEVMQAYEEGKQIQIRAIRINKSDWVDSYGEPNWDWDFFEYRIKPEEEKPVRMTNRQLAEWLSRGFGSWKTKRSPTVYMDISYPIFEENTPVSDSFHIRPWGSDDWVEPTVDIYERDCKGAREE